MHVKLADVDNDGDLDLLGFIQYTNRNGDGYRFVVCRNDGSGLFALPSQPVPIANGFLPPAIGDFDGDGDLDVLVLTDNNTVGTVGLFSNDGSGSFSHSNGYDVTMGPEPKKLAVGDIDGDNDLDLMVVCIDGLPFTRTVYVRRNDGTGHFTSEPNIPNGNHKGLTLADVDADGDLDCVTVDAVSFNNGTGTFSVPGLRATPDSQLGGVVDLDGDGDLDRIILATSYFGAEITYQLNQPLVTAAARPRSTNLFAISPNPAKTSFTLSGAIAGQQVQLFNTQGQLVAEPKPAAGGVLPFALPPGLYVVRSGGQAQKLVVE